MGCEALSIEYYESINQTNKVTTSPPFLTKPMEFEKSLYGMNTLHKKKRIKAVSRAAISGLRYYNPAQGKWLSRDPFEEPGGNNLYGFVGNNAISRYDVLGMYWGEGIINGIGGFFKKLWGNMNIDIGDCGSTTIQRVLIPDAPLGFDFSECCRKDDKCYDTKGNAKNTCDSNFDSCLKDKIQKFARWYRPGAIGSKFAKVFGSAVRGAKSCVAYKAAQVAAGNKCPICK